jgi:outer membrane protein OmpA-like peptidoglycan-associated protein
MTGASWVAGDFEGEYQATLGEHASGARVFDLNILEGTVRALRRVDAPPAAGTGIVPLRQAKLERCYLEMPDGQLEVCALRALEIHDWSRFDQTDHHGRLYGRVRGTIYAQLPPDPPPAPAPIPVHATLAEAAGQSAVGQSAVADTVPVTARPAPWSPLPIGRRIGVPITTPGASLGRNLGCGLASLLLLLLFAPLCAGPAATCARTGHGSGIWPALPLLLPLLLLLLARLSWRSLRGWGALLALLLLIGVLAFTRVADCGSRVVQIAHGVVDWRERFQLTLGRTASELRALFQRGSPLSTIRVDSPPPPPDQIRISAREALAHPNAFFDDPRRRVYLSADPLFDFGSAELKLPVSDELRTLAQVLNTAPTRAVVLEGHADTIGDADRNLTLSQKRAEAVARWLVQEGHVNADQIQTVGLGSTQPLVSPQGDRDAQRRNRRVEVRIKTAPSAAPAASAAPRPAPT